MPPLIGRLRERERLEAAVERARGGDGALILLAGEPGIGKTRLAEHAATAAEGHGFRVAWGRCWEAGGAPAYYPWTEVLAALALGALPSGVADTGEAPAEARFHGMQETVQRLREASRDAPVAILLDDLHAGDVPSLLLLQLLARSLRGVPLLVVGTYRDQDARARADVGQILAKVGREGEVLLLSGLSDAELLEWVGSEAHARELCHATAGNPLFVKELIGLGGRAGPQPAGIGAVLDEHLGRVGVPVRSLLEAGAILGREFTLADVSALVGPCDAITLLGEAEQAGLIVPAARPGARSFVHVLLRDRLVESLPAGRRSELHRQAGERLFARAELVGASHHLIAAEGAATPERVLEVTRDAVLHLLSELAFEHAAELGERALALVGREALRAVAEVTLAVAEALLRAGMLERGKARCLEGAGLARDLGASDLLARAALAYGSHFASASVDPVMVSLLEGALTALEPHDHPVRARVMARLAAALTPPRPGDAARILALGREAIAAARRLGDPETLLHTLLFGASAFGYQVDSVERMALLTETMELARRLGNKVALIHMLGFAAVSNLEAGRRAEANALRQEFESLLAALPQPQYQARRLMTRIGWATLEGDLDAARALASEMLDAAERSNVPVARLGWALTQIAIAHASGDPASIKPVAPRVLAILESIPPMVPYTAWVLAALGRAAEARVMLERVAGDAAGFPWLIIAGDAAVILGDSELAERLAAPLAEYRFKNRIFWGPAGALALGPTARTLAELQLILGRPADALALFEEAIEFCERLGATALGALAHAGREKALAQLGRAGLPAPIPPSGPPQVSLPTLTRQGEMWALAQGSNPSISLRDGKGTRYLDVLLSRPGQDIHVLELVGAGEAPADAGPLLDEKAKAQYRRRLGDLRDQVEEATRNGDPGRADRAQAEIDALADALAGAVGLGGRDRRAASNVERARINVQRRLRDVLDRVAAADPALGRYLDGAIRTGAICVFRPP